LALVNRNCYNYAAPFLYRVVRINITSLKKFREEISELTDNPLRRQCLEHARRLELKGRMPSLKEPEDMDAAGGKYTWSSYTNPAPNFPHESNNEDPSFRLWMPLASLMREFRYLSSISYACYNPFPDRLLRAIHQHHPTCKLEVHTVHMRSLRDLITDPHKLALMKSPCLSELTIRYVGSDRNGRDQTNENSIQSTLCAVALAPNLTRLDLIGCHLHGILPPPDTRPLPQRARKGRETLRITTLNSLSFTGIQDITEAKLRHWARHVDFSKLRSFSWSMPRVPPEALIYAAENLRFNSLETLELFLPPSNAEFTAGLGMFLDSLKPLVALRLWGPMDASVFERTVERHGTTLRELKLRPFGDYHYREQYRTVTLSPEKILNLQDNCPLLEELQLRIPRSLSDRQEIRYYEALATFPRLSKLSLELDCSCRRPEDQPPIEKIRCSDFDRQVYLKTLGRSPIYYAHIRDLLINAAIDETLARSIWNVITAGDKKKKHPLRQLAIDSRWGGRFTSYPFTRLSEGAHIRFDHISRSYLLKRSDRDDDPSGVEIVETERPELETTEGQLVGVSYWKSSVPNDEKFDKIFRQLWPPKHDMGNPRSSPDWRCCGWSSRPLELGTD
jgi:hypothetical protein